MNPAAILSMMSDLYVELLEARKGDAVNDEERAELDQLRGERDALRDELTRLQPQDSLRITKEHVGAVIVGHGSLTVEWPD